MIISTHPQMFRIMKNLEVGDGWLELINSMCDEIEPLLSHNMWASQIKEKFGLLRVYMCGYTDEIDEIIERYEELSGTVCENCGKPGKREKIGGWIETLCEVCK